MDPANTPEAASDLEKELGAVLAACFTRGTSQTILLLGMNSYRMSERLKEMAGTHPNVIALSITGSLFPEEGPAVELLTKQLSLAVGVQPPAKDSLAYFKEVLAPGHNLLLTVSEADCYAHKGQQQRLLYSLLELVSEPPCGMLLVMQSTRLDFTELLEKRLKSRLNAKPFCCMQAVLPEFVQEVVSLCVASEADQQWKECFSQFIDSADFLHYYALGKTSHWFQYVLRRAKVENIRLQDKDKSLDAVLREEAAGLTLTFLKELPPYEIAVLIAHAMIERNMGFSKFDLAFAWLKSKAKNGIVNHSRRSFFRVSSRMVALGLLEKQSKHVSDELSIVRLQLEADELFALIADGSIRGLSLFGGWLKSV